MNASNNTRTAIERMKQQADNTYNPALLDCLADQFDMLGQYQEANKCRNKADGIRRTNRQLAEEA